MIRKTTKIVLLLSLCHFAALIQADDDTDNVLVDMFTWWNGAIKKPNGFTENNFRRYFTEDAVIIVNGNERVRGIKPMVEHFKRIQQATESVEIVLPFKQGFVSGNRIFTHHEIRARAKGIDSLSQIMGYAVTENGKLALINFLDHEMPLDNKNTVKPN